jgi:poly(A) polymerase
MISPALTKKLRQHPVIKAVYRTSQDAGIPIYLVGGAVRDLLAAVLPEKDFDFVLENKLLPAARLFSRLVSGSLIQWSSDPLYYRVILYRDTRRIEVDFSDFQGDDLNQDLHNRDFTVNAMALPIQQLFQEESPKPYDPLGGAADLQKGILRSASRHSFDNDPLRMLRAVRIAKARSLAIDQKTKEEIGSRKERLLSAAAERIRSEFFKTLSFPGAEDSLKLLDSLGLLSVLLPETQDLKDRRIEELHGRSWWEHSLERVRWCEWTQGNWGALCPGFEEKLNSHFLEEIEADIDRLSLLKLGGFLFDCQDSSEVAKDDNVADAMVSRFKLGKRATTILRRITGHPIGTLQGFLPKKLNPRVYFRFFCNLGPEGLDLLVLSWSNFIACEPKQFDSPLDTKLRNLLKSFVSYYFDEYIATAPQPLITGKDIMDQFRLAEGKVIGSLLGKVAEAEEEGLLRSPKEAMLYVEDLLGQQQRSHE